MGGIVSMVFALLAKNFPASLIHNFKPACLLVYEDSEALQKFKVLITDFSVFERVTGDVFEGLGHIRERFPCLPGTPFSFSKKG